MMCPDCGNTTKVVGVKENFRRRYCPHCDKVFFTEEVVTDGTMYYEIQNEYQRRRYDVKNRKH